MTKKLITLVRQGPFLLVQFNTTCEQSLPACDAMCCRMRPWFNVKVNEDEAHLYHTEIKDGVRVLSAMPNGDCVYLHNARCSIYASRPHQCRQWHCSPKGNQDDRQIIDRANGWLLMVGSDEVIKKLTE